jgi:hypothetical protein
MRDGRVFDRRGVMSLGWACNYNFVTLFAGISGSVMSAKKGGPLSDRPFCVFVLWMGFVRV